MKRKLAIGIKKQGHGHLAGITSISGLRGSREGLSYSTTKSFQIKYLDGLRQDSHHNKTSITGTDIMPGFFDTEMAKSDVKFWVYILIENSPLY